MITLYNSPNPSNYGKFYLIFYFKASTLSKTIENENFLTKLFSLKWGFTRFLEDFYIKNALNEVKNQNGRQIFEKLDERSTKKNHSATAFTGKEKNPSKEHQPVFSTKQTNSRMVTQPSFTWVKVQRINPDIARNLALFGKARPFATNSPRKYSSQNNQKKINIMPSWIE